MLNIADLGCADGYMMTRLAAAFADREFNCTGFDCFPKGPPEASADLHASFVQADLLAMEPLPVASGDVDVVIASPFVKHHPRVVDLLREVHRILKDGGILVVLDPRPWVVHVGRTLAHFSVEFTPSIWSERSMRHMLQANFPEKLQMCKFERYWISSRRRLFVPGIEGRVPSPLLALLALLQSAVVNNLRSSLWSVLAL